MNNVTYIGEIPFSLLNISSLRKVALVRNNLNGSLPHEMCHKLPQLEIFRMNTNQLEGSIPRSIGNCTMLEGLYLEENFLTGTLNMLSSYLNNLHKIYLTYPFTINHYPSFLFISYPFSLISLSFMILS